MKKFLLIILLMPMYAFAQKDTTGLNLPYKEGRIVYEEIINVENKSKSDLLVNAKQWFVDYFKSSKDVIQNEDKETGRIIGKGILFFYAKTWAMSFKIDDKITIQIDCKDNKYRYRLYDIITSSDYARDSTPEEMVDKLSGAGKSRYTKSLCRKILENLSLETKNTIASLKSAMATKSDSF